MRTLHLVNYSIHVVSQKLRSALLLSPIAYVDAPEVDKPGFGTESMAFWSGTVVCPASSDAALVGRGPVWCS